MSKLSCLVFLGLLVAAIYPLEHANGEEMSSDKSISILRTWALGTSSSNQRVKAISLDSNGDIYVTGRIRRSSRNLAEEILLLKFSHKANFIWGKSLQIGNAWGNDLAIDRNGNIYVAGAGNASDALVSKFDKAGNLLWSRIWDGPVTKDLNPLDIANAVEVDEAGDIYLAGYTSVFGGRLPVGTPYFYSNILLLKFSKDGDLKWSQSWGGPTADKANAIALDQKGNIYVAGYTSSFAARSLADTKQDILVLKYSRNGEFLWARTWGEREDEATAIAVDPLGNIFLAGTTKGYEIVRRGETFVHVYKGDQLVLLKFGENGDFSWNRTWAIGEKGSADATDMVIDSIGNLHVSANPGVILKYSTKGDLLSSAVLDGTLINSLAMDSTKEIVVGGQVKRKGAVSRNIKGILASFEGKTTSPNGTINSPKGVVSSPAGTLNELKGEIDRFKPEYDVFIGRYPQ